VRSEEALHARTSGLATSGPRIALVVAMARNRVIGNAGALPWHLPSDLKRFKSLTLGHHIVMGRKTWESIGRALPGRVSVVVTRDPDYRAPGARVAASLAAALEACRGDSEIFVIGGAELFEAALPRAQRLYLTTLHRDFAGDVSLPEFDLAQWRQVSAETVAAGPDNAPEYTFAVYDRGRRSDLG